jgi:hypothetical protein
MGIQIQDILGLNLAPFRLLEQHFIEFIPPTSKERSARQSAVCCSRRVAEGKRIRKETRYY